MPNRKTIAVIFGGTSGEHAVSLQSAAAVLDAIDRRQYDVIAVGITRAGRWLRYDGPFAAIAGGGWEQAGTPCLLSPDRADHGLLCRRPDGGFCTVPVDIALPILHGRGGEDGTVQGLCELAGIPVAGCGTLASALCMDKHRAHLLAAQAGVAVPRGFTLTRADSAETAAARAEALGWPLFVKPLRAGSSLGVTRAAAREALPAALCAALRYDDEVLVEKAVPGFEIGCAVLGPDKNGALLLGAVDEIELGAAVHSGQAGGGFFDYTEKYTLQHSAIHTPARIPAGTAAQAQQTAAAVYRALGCRGFARVDLFLTPAGEIVFNEVNTIPGFTAHSRWPAMMRAAGYPFTEMVGAILAQAEGRL